jgi:predicted anti-sigma-YlaC factor YlaD
LNCKRVILEISNYLDGELDATIMQEIEFHLRDCEGCTVIVRQTKLTVDIFCSSEPLELPPDVRTRLHKTLTRNLQRPNP